MTQDTDITKVAVKYDDGKPGFELLPTDALGAVNDVLRFGAKKYAANNWQRGFHWTRLGNAAVRHILSWVGGETTDPESGLPHLAHAGCMVLFALSHQLRSIGTDDRPVPPAAAGSTDQAAAFRDVLKSSGATVVSVRPVDEQGRVLTRSRMLRAEDDGVQGQSLNAPEHSLGAEPLTRERLEQALRHAVNCTSLDSKIGIPDYVLSQWIVWYVPDFEVDQLYTVEDLKYRIVRALVRGEFVRRCNVPADVLAEQLVPHVQQWLQGRSGPQLVAKLNEDEPSAYSSVYDALAHDLGITRADAKDRFLAAMFNATGPMGGSREERLKAERQPEPWVLARNDDGTVVRLSSYSGGGAPEGAWGRLSLRFSKPGDEINDRVVHYVPEDAASGMASDPLDVVVQALVLTHNEAEFIRGAVATPYRGASYGHVRRALSETISIKAAGYYKASTAQFAAHVFAMACLLARSESEGGAPLRKGGELSEQG